MTRYVVDHSILGGSQVWDREAEDGAMVVAEFFGPGCSVEAANYAERHNAKAFDPDDHKFYDCRWGCVCDQQYGHECEVCGAFRPSGELEDTPCSELCYRRGEPCDYCGYRCKVECAA